MALELLPTITELDIKDIVVGERLRPVSEAEVAALIEVIKEFGHTTAVLVRRKKACFELVDGMHRLEATRRVGLNRIPVRVYTMTDLDQRELEATQNLAGAMSPLEDAVFLAAWRKAYQERHPETARGVAGALAKHGLQRNSSSFAETVARKRGIGIRQVNKITAAGEKITKEERDLFYGSDYQPTIADLEAIAKLKEPGERSSVVRRLVYGNARSAVEARKSLLQESGALQAPVKDPVEDGFNALKKALDRAPKEALRRALEIHFDTIAPLVEEIAERRAPKVVPLRPETDQPAGFASRRPGRVS